MTTARKGVAEHFDAWAARYDAEIRERVPRYDEIHDGLIALLQLHPTHRVLDLGTGTGTTSLRVLEAFPGAQVVGVDVSSEMIGRARLRLRGHRGRWTLRQSDLATPALDGLFDAVVSVLAVHHLWADEKRHLFSLLWEHLAPGGIFILADAFRPAADRLREHHGKRRAAPRSGEHDHPDSVAEHLGWLAAAGFAGSDVVWRDDEVGLLVAWKARNS